VARSRQLHLQLAVRLHCRKHGRRRQQRRHTRRHHTRTTTRARLPLDVGASDFDCFASCCLLCSSLLSVAAEAAVEQAPRHKVKQRCPVLSSIVAVKLRNEQLAARHHTDAARHCLVVGRPTKQRTHFSAAAATDDERRARARSRCVIVVQLGDRRCVDPTDADCRRRARTATRRHRRRPAQQQRHLASRSSAAGGPTGDGRRAPRTLVAASRAAARGAPWRRQRRPSFSTHDETLLVAWQPCSNQTPQPTAPCSPDRNVDSSSSSSSYDSNREPTSTRLLVAAAAMVLLAATAYR
jgi:hypothetical protein